jgi:hypothetical protein
MFVVGLKTMLQLKVSQPMLDIRAKMLERGLRTLLVAVSMTNKHRQRTSHRLHVNYIVLLPTIRVSSHTALMPLVAQGFVPQQFGCRFWSPLAKKN